MSGLEIFGLVLGGLPLLVTAAEGWDKVLGLLNRWRKYAPAVEEFQQKLTMEKTIFRTECLLILTVLAGRGTARIMLSNLRHSHWADQELDQMFANQLGDHGKACDYVVKSINLRLDVLERKLKSFVTVPFGSAEDRICRPSVAQRLKYAIWEPSIKIHYDELRSLNRDFLIVAEQIGRLGNNQVIQPLVQFLPTAEEEIRRFQNIRNAFLHLYNALGNVCEMHAEHSAHIRLPLQNVEANTSQSPLVTFNVAFAYVISSTSATSDPVWISIDSIFGDSATNRHAPQQHSGTSVADKALADLDRNLRSTPKTTASVPESQSSHPGNESKPTFQFSTSAIPAAKRPRVGYETASSRRMMKIPAFSDTNPNILVDLWPPESCVDHNLCTYLQLCSKEGHANQRVRIIEATGAYNHSLYLSTPTDANKPTKAISLSQVISSVSQKVPSHKLLQYPRLRLAKQLAAAVLQFHATPLMKDSWRSEDVFFFDTNEDSRALGHPHLNVRVRKPQHNNNNNDFAYNTSTPSTDLVIRNQPLFSLALILLELAYQAPFQTLRLPSNIYPAPGPGLNHAFSAILGAQYSDLFTANRLIQELVPKMGLTYSKIVKKCLHCDFGLGVSNLGDRGLQEVFYRDVVCELERLEEGAWEVGGRG